MNWEWWLLGLLFATWLHNVRLISCWDKAWQKCHQGEKSTERRSRVLTMLLACSVVQASSNTVTACPCPAAFSGLCHACRVWFQTVLVLVWAWWYCQSLKVSGERERTWVFRTICSADIGCKWKFEGGRFTFSKDTRLKKLRLVLIHWAIN